MTSGWSASLAVAIICIRNDCCDPLNVRTFTQVASRPSSSTEVAEFAGQLFFRLWRASHTRIAAALETLGLTPALFGLLNVLAARDGAMQQELGSAMGVDPSTMVALIDGLESSGLAKRRPHPTDRRARAVTITPKGRRALERGRGMAAQVEDEVLRGLTADERRELLTLLRRALDSAPPQSLWRAEEGD
jgi:DNA-binding MarR family transcriptional regulator